MSKYSDLNVKKFPYLGYSPNLIEYFLIIGYETSFIQNEIIKGIEEQEKDKQLPPPSQNDVKVFREYKCETQPTILNSISSNYNNEMLENDMIINLCFPSPPNIYYSSSENKQYEPNQFSVVFFLNGDSLDDQTKIPFHGYTFIFYESQSTKTNKKIFIPKAFTVISQYPFFCLFNTLCKDTLAMFRNDKLEIPLEILLYNILNFTPSPINYPLTLSLFPTIELSSYVRQKAETNKEMQTPFRMSLVDPNSSAIGPMTIPSSQKKLPLLNQLSGYPIFDFNLSEIFNILPIPTMVEVLVFNLLECEMLFFSKNIEVLNLVMYIISSLSYPCNDSIYLWHILSVGKSDIVEMSGNSKFVGKPFASMIGVNCTYNTEIDTVQLYNTHFVVDLDNKKLYLRYNEEDEKCEVEALKKKAEEEGRKYPKLTDVQKIKRLRDYVRKIIDEKKVHSAFLAKIISDLVNELNSISKKVLHSTYNHQAQMIPKFFVTENNNLILNKNIQEAFYNFVLNILQKYSSFYSLYSSFEQEQNQNESSVSPDTSKNNINTSNQNELNKSIQANTDNLNTSNQNANLSNSMMSNDSDNEDEDINSDDIKLKKPYYLKYSRNMKHFAEEEGFFCYLFKNSVKYMNYVAGFLKSYKCMGLYKIPLVFSEEFIGLKNIDPIQFRAHFFDIIDKFFMKNTPNSNDHYELSTSIGSGGIPLPTPQTMMAKQINFNQFYCHYDDKLKKVIYDETVGSSIIKGSTIKAFKKEKITYKYKTIDLDKNVLLKYIYILSNYTDEEIEELFPSIEIQKGNVILDVKAREIPNSIERALIDYKTVGARELLIYSILNVICVCSHLIDEKMNVDSIFLFIGTERYCIRKYLAMLLTNFYRQAEKKLKASKDANIEFEITWFKKTIQFLKFKKMLPDEQMMSVIELFAEIEKEYKPDNNEEQYLLIQDEQLARYNSFLKKNYCKDGTHPIDYFMKLSENSDYDGDLKITCEKCNMMISPKITVQIFENHREYQEYFYSPKKLYNESSKINETYFPEQDEMYYDKEQIVKIIINLLFYISYTNTIERSIAKVLYVFLLILSNKQ